MLDFIDLIDLPKDMKRREVVERVAGGCFKAVSNGEAAAGVSIGWTSLVIKAFLI
jgi:hypothetical protein